jgi:predicted metal-dependent hydrolase
MMPIFAQSIMTKSYQSDLPLYRTRVSRRAKYVQIKISARAGLEVVVPHRLVNRVNVDSFVQSKRAWIMQHIKHAQPVPATAPLPEHIELSYLSARWRVQYEPSLQTTFDELADNVLVLGADYSDYVVSQRLLKTWLRGRAQQLLVDLHQLSLRTGLSYQTSKIRAQKTRWGSCSAQKTITLNAHLLFLPTHLVEYVMVHELAHTVHLNHSQAFWALVQQHDSQYKQHRQLLKLAEQLVPAWAYQ